MITLCPLSSACAEPDGKVSAIGCDELLLHPARTATRITHRLKAGNLMTFSLVLHLLGLRTGGALERSGVTYAGRLRSDRNPGMPHIF
jgi:hypothetical protein